MLCFVIHTFFPYSYSVLCSCCRFFYLWNPSKSIFRTIPYPPGDRNMMTTSTTHGIGPDLRIRDILIIRIIYFCHGIDEGTLPGKILPHAEVYSQNTNSWSRIESVVPCFAFDEPTSFVNGAIHWRALNHVIMYFVDAHFLTKLQHTKRGPNTHLKA
jgi:hypothetical protein